MVKALAGAAAAALLAACAPVALDRRAPAAGETEGGALFVAGKFGNTLSRVDLASGTQTAQVKTCANPHELAVSPDGVHVALACYGGTSVDIFRTDDLARVASIDLGTKAAPHGIVDEAPDRAPVAGSGVPVRAAPGRKQGVEVVPARVLDQGVGDAGRLEPVR